MQRSTSEWTQGSRLRRFQNLILQLNNFVNYNPPTNADSFTELSNKAGQLEQLILSTSNAEFDYRLATEERQKAFRNDTYSVIKVLKYIRAIVVVDAGKNSRTAEIIAQAIRKIIPNTRKKAESAMGAAIVGELAPKRSQSHNSYASMTLAFREIVELLDHTTYNTNVPELQPANLQLFATRLTQLNDRVAQTFATLEILRRQRDGLFKESEAAITRVKKCIKYLYGVDSDEYNAVKSI